MNENFTCEKCGHKMKPLSDIRPIGMTCPNCGWGWATSYFEPIEVDSNVYHISLIKLVNYSADEVKLISGIANCNFIEAKKLIDNAPSEIFNGTAVEVKSVKEKLEAVNIEFAIDPEFPY